MEYIEATKAAEEVARQTNLGIGIMVIMLALIAGAMWVFTVVYLNRTARKYKAALRRKAEEIREEYEKEKRQLGGDFFAARMMLKAEAEKERQKRAEAEAERDDLKKKYDTLKAEAACCPADGMRMRIRVE